MLIKSYVSTYSIHLHISSISKNKNWSLHLLWSITLVYTWSFSCELGHHTGRYYIPFKLLKWSLMGIWGFKMLMSSIKKSFEPEVSFASSWDIFNFNCLVLWALRGTKPEQQPTSPSLEKMRREREDTLSEAAAMTVRHQDLQSPRILLSDHITWVQTVNTESHKAATCTVWGESSQVSCFSSERKLCDITLTMKYCWWWTRLRPHRPTIKSEEGQRSERTNLWSPLPAAASTLIKSHRHTHTLLNCPPVRHWITASYRPWPLTSPRGRGTWTISV